MDLAVVAQVFGEIDRRHAALTELALNAVAGGEGGLQAVQLVGLIGHSWALLLGAFHKMRPAG